MAMAEATGSARDYSLTGAERDRAIARGLAAAEWYHSDIPRKEMKALMQRTDQPAIRDTILWLVLLAATAAGGIALWGTWWALPFWLAYGVLYGSACDARWHECGHGTAFRTAWMNDAVYVFASFLAMRNPVSWRWSHARHHTDTIIVGRDPEISVMRPVDFARKALAFIGIPDAFVHFGILMRNAMGRFGPDERDYVPDSDIPRATRWAQLFVAIHLAAWAWALVSWSLIPLLLIGGPRIYGCWQMVMTGLLQHGGLAEDVLDHRLNTRTVLMDPVNRWLYLNMNYHVEHHMFPMVPYHALPRLHALIKHDLPPPNTSIGQAYAQMIRTLVRQRREPGHYLRRTLPPTAQPYREDLHDADALPEERTAS